MFEVPLNTSTQPHVRAKIFGQNDKTLQDSMPTAHHPEARQLLTSVRGQQ